MAKPQRQRWTFVERARVCLGLTQAQLAARLGIGSPYMSQLESGARRASPPLLVKIADVLNVDIESLEASRPTVIYSGASPSVDRRSQRVPVPKHRAEVA